MNEILIYGEVGTDVKDSKVVAQLAKFTGEPVRVRINSPGGDVYAGLAIMNALRAHDGEVTAVVEGMAASAASFIAIGGADRVVARPSAELMIHSAWSMGAGNSEALMKIAGDLDRISLTLAGIYADKSGRDISEMRNLMAAETWFNAAEALDAGLIDAVEDARQPPPESAVNVNTSTVFASWRYSSRAVAPPPPVARSVPGDEVNRPISGQEGETMEFLNKLAQITGKSEDQVLNSIASFIRNEVVPISGEVDVSYPTDVKIVPTERITVDALVGDKAAEAPEGEDTGVEVIPEGVEPQPDSAAVQLAKSAGLTFAMGDVAEGFEASVDEGGTVTIKAPSGVEPGDVVEFTVLVNETAVPLSVTVRALSEDEPGEAPSETLTEQPMNKISLDPETYNILKAQARAGVQMSEEKARKDRVAEVEDWVRTGRIAAAARDKALSVMERDAALAREIYGSNPENTVPVAEVGHVGSGIPKSKADELLAKANAINNKKKGV